MENLNRIVDEALKKHPPKPRPKTREEVLKEIEKHEKENK